MNPNRILQSLTWLLIAFAVAAIVLDVGLTIEFAKGPSHAAAPPQQLGKVMPVPLAPAQTTPGGTTVPSNPTWASQMLYGPEGPDNQVAVTEKYANGDESLVYIDQFFTKPWQSCPGVEGDVARGGIPCITLTYPSATDHAVWGWKGSNVMLSYYMYDSNGGEQVLSFWFDTPGARTVR